MTFKNLTDTSPYTLRPATFQDADEIWSVMNICCQAMTHKEQFICDDLDYVKDILSGHGFAVVACDSDGKIVGNLLVKYPGIIEENLGYDVFSKTDISSCCDIPKQNIDNLSPEDTYNFPTNIALTTENLNRVLHMDSASVLPKHRGYKLESQMVIFAESLIDTSKYHYSFATVAPKNLASLKSLERIGYKVMVTKEKYGGLSRCILMKILFLI